MPDFDKAMLLASATAALAILILVLKIESVVWLLL